MIDEFDRTLQRRDIAQRLNVGLDTASLFLRLYGHRCGGYRVIGDREFRFLQEEGKVAEFVKSVERMKQKAKNDTSGQHS